MAGSEALQSTLTNAAPSGETNVITALAGEFARVRFKSRPSNISVKLHITNDGFGTIEEIIGAEAYATGALRSGDEVKVSATNLQNVDAGVDLILEIGT